jgi:putative DNA methylase
MEVKTRKKLIEVALPLDAINAACVREASPFTPRHPRSLHVWWARRRLAAARAVIFTQILDDPSEYIDELKTDLRLSAKAESILRTRIKRWEDAVALAKKAEAAKIKAPPAGERPTLEEVIAEIERGRVFGLIERLVIWENTTNEKVLNEARDEIWKSWRRTCADNANHPKVKELFDPKRLPAFHDPFAGGGALPLEAQRLGLEAYASDLNPVAVLINKAMIEIPPKFAGNPPVNPEARNNSELIRRQWKGAQGLAEDIRYYGRLISNEAKKRIGTLYPQVEVTAELAKGRPDLKTEVGKQLPVIAWLWARTVKSPNPAYSKVAVPLASTFVLCTKNEKEAYIEPIIEKHDYTFIVRVGKYKNAETAKLGTKIARGSFSCLMSGTPITGDYIKNEAKAGRMGVRLMAILAEGSDGRVYLAPTAEQEEAALKAKPDWKPEGEIARRMTGGNCTPYGLTTWGDLFTPRQLVALNTFSELINEAMQQVSHDALEAGINKNSTHLRDGGTGALAYSESIVVYLGMALSRWTDLFNSLVTWNVTNQNIKNLFARQAVPMAWDFPESNPFGSGTNFNSTIESFYRLFVSLPAWLSGSAQQFDAQSQNLSLNRLVSTDPPYYDNIGYADLSDFFYVWLRRTMNKVYPDLFSTLAVPKAEELVATRSRHGSKEKAEEFFLNGMTKAMHRLSQLAHPAFPVTIYYAFKQSESDGEAGNASTGWETFLDAIIRADYGITGTWPVRTERTKGIKGNINALASSIVLVCRKRDSTATTATRRDFVSTLKNELPSALKNLQKGNIAPVDLAQASIGPGMAIYTRYSKILDADGKALSVRMALALINQTLDEVLEEQEGEFDADTRWALAWFEQHGFSEGTFGDAESLSKAKVTSVNGLVEAGIIKTKSGKVALLKKSELDKDWSPETDKRLTVWEMTHHLIRGLDEGEAKASNLLARIGPIAEAARDLAYRLYSICDKKNWPKEGQDYNGLVQAWPNLQAGAKDAKTNKLKQGELI